MDLVVVSIIVLGAARSAVLAGVGMGDLKICIVTGFCMGLKRLPYSLLITIAFLILFSLLVKNYKKKGYPSRRLRRPVFAASWFWKVLCCNGRSDLFAIVFC